MKSVKRVAQDLCCIEFQEFYASEPRDWHPPAVYLQLVSDAVDWLRCISVAGFHCHTIIKTIQQRKSRIEDIKEDEYSKSLAKVQVCAMFCVGDIRRNVLLKFIRICMETPCL